MQITVLHNQSLLDVCLQHTGSLVSVFDIAMANNLSITDDLVAGQLLVIPEDVKKDNDILNYYTAKQVQPATAIVVTERAMVRQKGISIWVVNDDFIVS